MDPESYDRDRPAGGRAHAKASGTDLVAAQEFLERSLLTWGTASVLVGTGLAFVGARTSRPAWVAAGRQHAGWGAVDAAIGCFGRWRRSRGSGSADDRREADRLARILRVNLGLDVGYVAVGVGLMVGPQRWLAGRVDHPRRVAVGSAVAVQGAALLVVDATGLRRLRGW